MNRRAFFIAIAVAIAGAVLLLLYVRKFEIEASGGEKIRLLVAVKQIERGKPITEDSLTTREVPIAYVEDRAIRVSEKPKILNLKAAATIRAQQTVFWSDVVASGEERRDLATLIQPGYRAVTISLREATESKLIHPGDYIDVTCVLGANASTVLLQRVLVLAVDGDTIDVQDKKQVFFRSTLSVSVTLPEAQLLAVAAERGRLGIALRAADDVRTAERVPDIKGDAITDSTARSNIAGIRTPRGPVEIK